MLRLRDDIIEWAVDGHLGRDDIPRALAFAGLTPRLSDWRRFLQTLLLWTGVVLLASGVIFFFAYNWQSLHRFAKFGIAEGLLAGAFMAAWYFGTEHPAGKAALAGASLLTGALLALVGQTYQTGADTFELFGWWAVLILPLVIVSRFAPLWLLWIGLLNLAVLLYLQTMRWGLIGVLFGDTGTIWMLFAVDSIALVVWEFGAARIEWLSRWGARVVAVLAGFFATWLGILAVFDSKEVGGWAGLGYAVWAGGMYFYYRHRVFDVFMLAGTVLTVIVLITAFLSRYLLSHGDPFGFLLIGLAIVGLSGAAAWWIRRLVREQAA